MLRTENLADEIPYFANVAELKKPKEEEDDRRKVVPRSLVPPQIPFLHFVYWSFVGGALSFLHLHIGLSPSWPTSITQIVKVHCILLSLDPPEAPHSSASSLVGKHISPTDIFGWPNCLVLLGYTNENSGFFVLERVTKKVKFTLFLKELISYFWFDALPLESLSSKLEAKMHTLSAYSVFPMLEQCPCFFQMAHWTLFVFAPWPEHLLGFFLFLFIKTKCKVENIWGSLPKISNKNTHICLNSIFILINWLKT